MHLLPSAGATHGDSIQYVSWFDLLYDAANAKIDAIDRINIKYRETNSEGGYLRSVVIMTSFNKKSKLCCAKILNREP